MRKERTAEETAGEFEMVGGKELKDEDFPVVRRGEYSCREWKVVVMDRRVSTSTMSIIS